MQFKGKIVEIGDTVTGQGTKGEWSKTPIWVEEIDKQYPNSLVFDAFNKNIDGLAKGMIVNVEYNGKVSVYNGHFYNSLLIYKIEKVFSDVKPQTANQQKPDSALNVPNPPNPIDDMSNNLPF
jgi:hypothetical protein